jgi:hypothetical protein
MFGITPFGFSSDAERADDFCFDATNPAFVASVRSSVAAELLVMQR